MIVAGLNCAASASFCGLGVATPEGNQLCYITVSCTFNSPEATPRGVNGTALAACVEIVEDFGTAKAPGVKDGESTLSDFLLSTYQHTTTST